MHKIKNKKLFGLIVSLVIVVLVALLAIGSRWYISQNSQAIPKIVRQSVSFPIYYPSPLPTGYSYQKGSARVQGSLVYYVIRDGDKKVYVTEQAAPPNPPNLGAVPGLKGVNSSAGQTFTGIYNSAPVGFLLSNTTLVNLQATKGVPSDVVSKTIQSMVSLP